MPDLRLPLRPDSIVVPSIPEAEQAIRWPDGTTSSLSIAVQSYQTDLLTIIDPPASPVPGVAQVLDSSGLPLFPLTVGPETTGVTLAQAVVELAERFRSVWVGRVQDGSTDEASAPQLQMGGDPVGLFFLRLTGDDVGTFRRVVRYQAGVLTFDTPFGTSILGGERYALLALSPDVLVAAIARAVASLGAIARVRMVATLPLAPAATAVTVPEGWEAVYRVRGVRSDGTPLDLPPRWWGMAPGRQLELLGKARGLQLTSLTLVGWRSALPPVAWNGTLDIDSDLVVAEAETDLYLGRASGPALDPENQLQKAAFALQEANQSRLTRRSRVPTNSKLVVP